MNSANHIFISAITIFIVACSQEQQPSAVNSKQKSINESIGSEQSIKPRYDDEDDLTLKETLGKKLFFDKNLSEPAGQSCASCHAPGYGFSEPDKLLPVSEGVIPGNFGVRNSLSASYVKFIPSFDIGATPADTVGGLFWDGRKIDLVDQAKAPFLNPLEMNNPSLETVVSDVMMATYAPMFLNVYGPTAFDDPVLAYDNIADAIATFERSIELNAFTSKYDYYKQGRIELSPEEALGLELFVGKAHCDHCHVIDSVNDPTKPDIFSNFKYFNLGVPPNTEFPYNLLPADTIDLGLGAITQLVEHNGKFKTPHLRNLERTAPYMHNGLFKSLEEVVRFYNTRDVPGIWPAPEVSENLTTGVVIGDIGLTPMEEEAIAEFLETLNDGFRLPPPPVVAPVN